MSNSTDFSTLLGKIFRPNIMSSITFLIISLEPIIILCPDKEIRWYGFLLLAALTLNWTVFFNYFACRKQEVLLTEDHGKILALMDQSLQKGNADFRIITSTLSVEVTPTQTKK